MAQVLGRAETVESFMTEFPVIVSEDTSAAEALRRMRDCGLRHLPVIRDGKVSGVVSERDLRLAGAQDHRAPKPVSQFMTKNPYCVCTSAPLSEVARAMAKGKFGAAVVVSAEGKVAGIFTTTDALDLLARLLEDKPSLHIQGMAIEDYFSVCEDG